jgi:hypothetical protein
MDSKFVMSLLCLVIVSYAVLKMFVKLANFLIGPILIIFAVAVILNPNLLGYTEDVIWTKIKYLSDKVMDSSLINKR